MDTLSRIWQILGTVPANTATSIGFIPGFATLDFAATYLRYKLGESFDPLSREGRLLSHLLMGTLNTLKFDLWGNYDGVEGTGYEQMMINLKELPSNFGNSLPFVGGYAALDFAFETLKTQLLGDMDPEAFTTMLASQTITAFYDTSNTLYWDNFVPQSLNQ